MKIKYHEGTEHCTVQAWDVLPKLVIEKSTGKVLSYALDDDKQLHCTDLTKTLIKHWIPLYNTKLK
jgi:hypothetical protein